MKFFIFFLISSLLTLMTFIAWSSYPWSIKGRVFHHDVLNVEPDEMIDVDPNPSVIKVLTFNLGFLYGRGSEGPGYVYQNKAFYKERLDKIVNELKEWSPDILFLQEIDFNSSRSHYMNQLEYIAKKAGYSFLAETPSWEANYIPFPYWPFSNHFGQMNSGGGILSRYPLSQHEVTLLDKPSSQPWWYNLFYLHRYFQKVTVSVGDKNFNLINLHLEAFDKNDRMLQVAKLSEKIKNESIDIVAGDFNMLPSSAIKRSSFYNDDNYEDDSSYEKMLSSGLLEVIPNDIYSKDEKLFFTFPAWAPDRRLDYVWYKKELKMMKAEVLPSALSDHLPLRASFQIDGPKFNLYSQ